MLKKICCSFWLVFRVFEKGFVNLFQIWKIQNIVLMCAIFWIYQIGKRSSIKHSKTRNTTKNLKNCMRPWIRSYQLFLDFCPRRALLAAPRGRKIVITRRSWQLQSSYFACADLWTCWIRFWYSRSPKLTKMICFWRFAFVYFLLFFIFFNFGVGGMRL